MKQKEHGVNGWQAVARLGPVPTARIRGVRAGWAAGHAHLVQVLGLDLVAGLTHLAGLLRIWEDELVDNDVVCVNLALGQLLDQPLCLIQGQELSNAHADERRLLLQGMREDSEGQVLSLSPKPLTVHLSHDSQGP